MNYKTPETHFTHDDYVELLEKFNLLKQEIELIKSVYIKNNKLKLKDLARDFNKRLEQLEYLQGINYDHGFRSYYAD